MVSYAFILFIAAVGIVIEGATLILAFKARSKPFLKYLPAIIILLLAIIYSLSIGISDRAGGFAGLVYILIAMITIPVFVISFLTAVIIDIARIINRRKETRDED